MNTLVVGNGFDIAHGLPTRYIDFLNYITFLGKYNYDHSLTKQNIESIFDNYKNTLGKLYKVSLLSILLKDKSKYDDAITIALDHISQYEDIVKNNIWYKLFRNIDKKKDTWIDFETEISLVVQKLESISESSLKEEDNILNQFNPLENLLDEKTKDVYDKEKIIYQAEKDLSQIINALNDYMILIDMIDTDCISPDIHQLDVSNVISFNYTDTYRRVYRKKNILSDDRIHFIHGKAGHQVGKNIKTVSNLVVGARDSLKGEAENHNLECVKFKKYFQRIYKKTGLKYKNFFISKDTQKNMQMDVISEQNLYFFGHSLAVTDGDVIKDLIVNYNKVVIFYHDDQQYQEEIQNLVDILGKEKTIQYAGNKIEFREQKPTHRQYKDDDED